ncbi:arylesterase [Streptomyces cyaneogriseus subsp. noncyanogenus]|uniref:Arylesterase n=1 Tax=Streptomyces cyaneogriseus subsp. noncyanogenus TaxID=477245 RepID=A0A0C5FKQ3_9ACTN|nr:alpha/beta hydrolase [Streptomyces cyaneogriseus]AJP00317.1 arylesterase [Streptomyces cyaneogriseus subsp. noncyanogenus]
MPFVTVKDGTQLYYEDWGTGRPVVLLASATMNSRMWEFQGPYLAGHGLRCIMPDRRGFGRSQRPWDGYDYDTLADDLACLIDHLGLQEVTLVGYAMGGGEAVRYLARHGSHRVARLALVCATTPYLLRAADNPDGIDSHVLEQTTAAMSADRAAYLAQITSVFFGGLQAAPETIPLSGQMMDWMAQQALDSSPRATVEVTRTLFTQDLREDVRGVDVPTLIVHGDQDPSAPLELCARRTAGLIPGSRTVVYEGGAHGLFATHADRLNKQLLEFAGQ